MGLPPLKRVSYFLYPVSPSTVVIIHQKRKGPLFPTLTLPPAKSISVNTDSQQSSFGIWFLFLNDKLSDFSTFVGGKETKDTFVCLPIYFANI